MLSVMRLPFAGSRQKSPMIGAIGLEFSLEHLHLVQLAHGAAGVRLRGHASSPLPKPFAELLEDKVLFRKLVKQTVAAGKFSGNRCVVAMPSTLTRVMSVNYQVNPGQSEAAAIGQLLRDRIGDELADFVVDFLPIHPDSTSRDRASLIAMCRKDTVLRFLELLNLSGLKPECMEIGPVAIKRLVDSLQGPGSQSAALVINCGRAKSFMTLISRRRVLSDDVVDFGEDGLMEQISRSLDVDAAMAQSIIQDADLGASRPDAQTRTILEIIRPELNKLVREIERGLIYAASESQGADDARVFLIGSLARWQGADRLLTDLVHHPVQTIPDPLQPFLRIGADIEPETGRPELAIPAGLALRDFYHV
jgi:type IV pilus assembly protein PilM